MLHNPTYSFKGLTIDSHAVVTAISFDNPMTTVDAQVNFYTDASCQYDIEQITYTVDTNKQVNNNAVELALLALPDFAGWSQVAS